MSEVPAITRPVRSWLARLRIAIGAFIVDNFFIQGSRFSRLLPQSRPERHGVEVVRDVPYLDSGELEHRLDIYRPKGVSGPLPVIFYVHGGGFRILSKESHWLFGLAFARRGYLVFNISYRLAPKNPYPAAVMDACDAFHWVAKNARAYDGDLNRLALAGESAGANLITSLTLAACYRRPEPWAQRVWETGVMPRAVLPACGYLQITDVERFRRGRRMLSVIYDRLAEVTEAYLGDARIQHPSELDLADPLVVLERGEPPHRPLPPFFAPVGTIDPLMADTKRLKAALDKLGALCEDRYYRWQNHAFHALVFIPEARRCWRDMYAFLERYMPASEEDQESGAL